MQSLFDFPGKFARLPHDSKAMFDGECRRSGDLGALDEDGYLHFHCMAKPILNLNGNKVDLRKLGRNTGASRGWGGRG
jgi:non-ribosomal peptide synthetase component E (peptide arylation enzyme)